MNSNDWDKYINNDPETKKNIEKVEKFTSNMLAYFFLMVFGGWFSVIMTLSMFVIIFYVFGYLIFSLIGVPDVASDCIKEMLSSILWIVKNCSGIGITFGIIMSVFMPFSKK